MQPQFVYTIHDLQQLGVRDIDLPLTHEWLADALADTEVTPSPDKPGRIKARIVMSGRDAVVRGSLHVPAVGVCGRCLQPAAIEVRADLSLFLVPERAVAPAAVAAKASKGTRPRRGGAQDDRGEAPKTPKGRGKAHRDDGEEVYEFTAEEADADTYAGDEIVLDPFLREAILLEIPIFPLCSEECPGIGPVPADPVDAVEVEQKIDPRLAPLLALKKST